MKHFLFAVTLLFIQSSLTAQTRLTEAPAPSARKAPEPTTDRKIPAETAQRKADATAKSGSAATEIFAYKLIALRIDDYGFILPESADDFRASLKGALSDSPAQENAQQLQEEMEIMSKMRTPVGVLNKLGEDGWELVHVVSQPIERSTRMQYYLKKRLK